MNDLFIKFIVKLGSIDNTALFAASIFPYSIFLYFLYKIKSVNNIVKTGYSLTVLFVFITTSILSIFSVGGIGVREYIFIVASQTIDINQDVGATIGILFTISASICCLPGLFIGRKL